MGYGHPREECSQEQELFQKLPLSGPWGGREAQGLSCCQCEPGKGKPTARLGRGGEARLWIADHVCTKLQGSPAQAWYDGRPPVRQRWEQRLCLQRILLGLCLGTPTFSHAP